MAFELRVEDSFSSAHNLKGYRGKCEDLHGHNWKVEIGVTAERLDRLGLVIDFKVIKGYLREVLDKLDHRHLNRMRYFKRVNPSSENIARYIYERLSLKLQRRGIHLKDVRVWESESASAIYFPAR